MSAAGRTLRRLTLVLAALSLTACKKDSGPSETSPYFIVTIQPPTPVVAVGSQITLTARITGPGSVTQTFVWTSQTPEVLSVNAAGVVSALMEGAGVIRAAWGLDQDVYKEVEVLVTAVPVEEEELDRPDSVLQVDPVMRGRTTAQRRPRLPVR